MNILLVDDDRFIIEALREKIRWDRLKNRQRLRSKQPHSGARHH